MSPTTPAEVTFCSFDFACIKKNANQTQKELYKNRIIQEQRLSTIEEGKLSPHYKLNCIKIKENALYPFSESKDK